MPPSHTASAAIASPALVTATDADAATECASTVNVPLLIIVSASSPSLASIAVESAFAVEVAVAPATPFTATENATDPVIASASVVMLPSLVRLSPPSPRYMPRDLASAPVPPSQTESADIARPALVMATDAAAAPARAEAVRSPEL